MMISTQEFSALIGDIYESAIHQSHWPNTIARLCDVFRGVRSDVAILDGLAGTIDTQFYHNYPAGLVEAVQANAHLNPLLPLVLVHPLDKPFIGDRDYGLEAFRKSLYFQRVLASIDVVDIMILPLARKVSVGAAVGVSRGRDVGPFTDEDEALALMLIPHLRRAVDISRLLKTAAAIDATIDSMMNAMSAPAILLGREGQILHVNMAAEQEFATAKLLRVAGGKLTSGHPLLRQFLASLETLGPEAKRSSDVLVRTDDRGDVLITAVALAPPVIAGAAATLLVVRVPEPDLVTPIAVARDAFGLTSAEVLTLAQIVAGRSLQEAADLIGIARSTVKSHLDSIFVKAGVSKQSELVAKVMSLMRPLP